MSAPNINKIAVIGSGTMGAGIAQVAAAAGFETLLYDINTEALEKAAMGIDRSLAGAVERGKMKAVEKEAIIQRIVFTNIFDDLKADLIIEAILEKLDLKVKLFTDLAAQNEPHAILATNTSSIPVTRIARPVPHPERVVGMHFFNPAQLMKLVEVIKGAETSDETARAVFQLAEKMGKVPVMAKDSPGFIVNRVARHFYVEGLKILEENVASHTAIDALLEASGFRMGPFKLMDLIGVDTNFSVTSSMFESFHYDGKFRPSRIQQQKVDAGHHGRKTGKGFYTYNKDGQAQ